MSRLRDRAQDLADQVSGRTEQRRLVDKAARRFLMGMVHEIRRFYMERPKAKEQDPSYERGYGDAVLDITRLMEQTARDK